MHEAPHFQHFTPFSRKWQRNNVQENEHLYFAQLALGRYIRNSQAGFSWLLIIRDFLYGLTNDYRH
jgi:hypothetical protein